MATKNPGRGTEAPSMTIQTEAQSAIPEYVTVMHPNGKWGVHVRQTQISTSYPGLNSYELMLVALDKEHNDLTQAHTKDTARIAELEAQLATIRKRLGGDFQSIIP